MSEPIRKLVSLHHGISNPSNWYISFGYYQADDYGRLEWTGDAEHCEISEDRLYELIKPELVKTHRGVE